MAIEIPGKGSDYALAYLDSNDNPLDGAKNYKVHLPKDVPVENFWSITVFDSQTRSMLHTDQDSPAVQSFEDRIQPNADGSYDIYFGATAPEGHESNWIQTDPDKGFFMALRIYSPTQVWLDKEWQASEVIEIK